MKSSGFLFGSASTALSKQLSFATLSLVPDGASGFTRLMILRGSAPGRAMEHFDMEPTTPGLEHACQSALALNVADAFHVRRGAIGCQNLVTFFRARVEIWASVELSAGQSDRCHTDVYEKSAHFNDIGALRHSLPTMASRVQEDWLNIRGR